MSTANALQSHVTSVVSVGERGPGCNIPTYGSAQGHIYYHVAITDDVLAARGPWRCDI